VRHRSCRRVMLRAEGRSISHKVEFDRQVCVGVRWWLWCGSSYHGCEICVGGKPYDSEVTRSREYDKKGLVKMCGDVASRLH
jgi:hypothetical protein